MKRQFAIFAVALVATIGAATIAPAQDRVTHPKTNEAIEAVNRGDFKIAYDILRGRAAKGDPEAQFELGMLYALGNGVKRDYVEAYKWTEIAARQKEPYAEFIRDEVAALMKPTEISFARREANVWMRLNNQ